MNAQALSASECSAVCSRLSVYKRVTTKVANFYGLADDLRYKLTMRMCVAAVVLSYTQLVIRSDVLAILYRMRR